MLEKAFSVTKWAEVSVGTAFSARLRSLDSSDGQEEATDSVRSRNVTGEIMHV